MAKAKVNIPWPHQNMDKGYVAYSWEAGNGHHSWAADFWERRRSKLAAALGTAMTSYTDNLPELSAIAGRVTAMGQAERAKEQAFITANLPDFDFSNIKEEDYITVINEIVRGEKQFKYALDRIQMAIAKGKEKRPNGEKYKNLAPTMSAVFMSYLTTAFTARMRNIAKTLPLTQGVAYWKANLDQLVEESIDEAMRKMLEESEVNSELDQIYGDAAQWKEIGEAYRSLTVFQRQMKNMIKTQLNLDELRSFFDSAEGKEVYRKTRRNKKKTGGFAQKIGWKSQRLSNNIGGNVQEYIETLVAEALPKGVTLTERGAAVMQGKTMKIDIAQFFQYQAEVDVNLSDVFYEMEGYLSQATSLQNAAERFQQFYDKNLAGLSQGNFYTVTNVKMASLGSKFSGLHNGKKIQLSELGNYIATAGIDVGKAQDFINVAYNTLSDAIFADRREEVQEEIRQILTSAAARLLFDDWSTIGVENTGTQILNFFNINGIIIPSSYFLIGLGKAMEQAAKEMQSVTNSWFSVQLHLPTTVVYHQGDWRKFGSTNEDIKNGIWDAWNEQAETAAKESYFITKFLYNFKSIIGKILGAG